MSGRSDVVDHAFDDLAHSLRVLLEAHYNAHTGGLLLVDRDEAIGNIENALTSVLNAFHSLYDAMLKGSIGPNWYATPALLTVLALRNARHHNKANKIRTLHRFHALVSQDPARMKQYVLVDFEPSEPDATHFDVYVSWYDLVSLLALPLKDSRLKATSRTDIETYIDASKFAQFAAYYDQQISAVFFNVVPLLINAGRTIVHGLKFLINPMSLESKIFLANFDQAAEIMLRPHATCGPIALPK